MTAHSLGIDPGKHGGAALLDERGAPLAHWITPLAGNDYDLEAMLQLVKACGEAHAFIEQPSAHQAGRQHAMTIGYGYGLWRMALRTHGLPVRVVRPQEWVPRVLTTKERKLPSIQRKKLLVNRAREVAPGIDWQALTNHDARSGVADAYFIADYGRRFG